MSGKSDSIIRINKRENPFAQIDRRLLNDSRMHLNTIGLLSHLLDKPDGWEISIQSLSRKFPDGRYAISRMIAEAESFGYINRTKTRANGRFKYIYEIYEFPEDNIASPQQVFRHCKTETEKQKLKNRNCETDTVDRAHSNNLYSNTEGSNTDQNDTDQSINDDDVSLVSPSSVFVKEVTRASLQRRDHTHAHEATRTIANPSPHLTFCLRIVADLPEWSGAEAFLSNCAEGQLIACATWLHLWNITANYGEYEFRKINDADRQKQLYKVYPFDNVKNIVGKIITQSDLCNPAPLHADHQTSLSAALREIAKENES